MNELAAVIYGIIQALCEFLPISSSGHLALLPHVLHLEDPGVGYDLLMHLGTTVAVILYFRKEIVSLLFSFFKKEKNDPERVLANSLAIITVVSVGMIVVIKFGLRMDLRDPIFIAANLIIFGFFLYYFDKKKPAQQVSFNRVNLSLCATLGILQAFAILPGVSRSGITITGARFFQLSRSAAGKISFLMSVPIILIGLLYKALDVFYNGASLPSFRICLIGVSISFILGTLVIHFFLKFIEKVPFSLFFGYRALLGAAILWATSY